MRFREADESIEGAGLGDDAGEFLDELLPIRRFKELKGSICELFAYLIDESSNEIGHIHRDSTRLLHSQCTHR